MKNHSHRAPAVTPTEARTVLHVDGQLLPQPTPAEIEAERQAAGPEPTAEPKPGKKPKDQRDTGGAERGATAEDGKE